MKILLNNQQLIDASFDSKEGKKVFWHSSAHVLAQAVKRLYPNAKCGIGPAIENGFYYDFEFDFPFGEEHLKLVEDEMREVVKESLALQVYEMSKESALAYMEEKNEYLKVELIREIPEKEHISFYKQGNYAELCLVQLIVSLEY